MEELILPIINIVGLAAAGVWVIRFVMKQVWGFVRLQEANTHDLVSNHIAHNTAALNELAAAIRELRASLAPKV